jgi:tetratricopeptide (TPR) repeat protein
MRIQSLRDLHTSFPDIDGLWNVLDLTETENKIQALLPAEGLPYSASQIEILTQQVRLYSLQGKQDKARHLLEICQSLLQKLPVESRAQAEIRFYLEEGRYYCLSMYPAKALDSFRNAWLAAEKIKSDIFAIDAAYMLSITLPAKQGKTWLQMAIKLAETSTNRFAAVWLSWLYMMEGWQAFDGRDFLKAKNLFEKALAQFERGSSKTLYYPLKWAQARTLRALGQSAAALATQEAIAVEMAGQGQSSGYVYLEIAECQRALENHEKAKSYYQLAHENLNKDVWYCENHKDDLTRILKNSKN